MYIYSDLNQFININKDNQQKINDVETIYQSIQNIISTPKGTRAFLPEFGSDVESLLFEPNTEETREAILTEVYAAILRWEPRVRMIYKESSVDAFDYDNHIFRVRIVFEVLGFGQEQYILQLNLQPGDSQ